MRDIIVRVGKKEIVVFANGKWRVYRRASKSTRERLRTLPNMDRWGSVHSTGTYIVPIPSSEKKS